jgi:hypothetical protein
VLVAQFLALAAQALAHLLPEAAGVDELHLALAVGGLAVADDPDVGADAGVVEHVGGQADDGLDQVVLQHVAADLALAAEPAPPVNSGEPLSTMPKRLPPSLAGRILLRRGAAGTAASRR